jgi:hypothetical protein
MLSPIFMVFQRPCHHRGDKDIANTAALAYHFLKLAKTASTVSSATILDRGTTTSGRKHGMLLFSFLAV